MSIWTFRFGIADPLHGKNKLSLACSSEYRRNQWRIVTKLSGRGFLMERFSPPTALDSTQVFSGRSSLVGRYLGKVAVMLFELAVKAAVHSSFKLSGLFREPARTGSRLKEAGAAESGRTGPQAASAP